MHGGTRTMGVSGKLSHEDVGETQELPTGQDARRPTIDEMEDLIQEYGWILGGEFVAQIRARYTR